jgi:hypothetical protein
MRNIIPDKNDYPVWFCESQVAHQCDRGNCAQECVNTLRKFGFK